MSISRLGIAQHREIGTEAGEAEKHGHEEAGDQPAQALVDLPRQDRGFPDQDAGDEGAEHGVHADQMRDQRHHAHQEQDHRDDRGRADEIVVGPADQLEHQAAPDGEADGEEGERAQHGFRHRGDVHRTVRGQAEDDGDDDPADGVVDHGGRDDDLTDIAAHEIHLAHHHGDDLHGRNRQRRAHEQRSDQALLRIGQQRIGQELSEREAAGEGHEDAGDRDRDRGPADLPNQLEVGLHAGEQQQEQDSELGNAVEHRLLLGCLREDRVLRFRPDPAEQRRSQDDAGEQLADHRGLADALHDLAETATDRDQQHDLRHQQEFGWASRFAALGTGRNGGEDKRRGDEADRSEQAPWHAGVFPPSPPVSGPRG
ncbi:hypothetical protein ABH970_007617 [Bradyrhizobium ottawaense]